MIGNFDLIFSKRSWFLFLLAFRIFTHLLRLIHWFRKSEFDQKVSVTMYTTSKHISVTVKPKLTPYVGGPGLLTIIRRLSNPSSRFSNETVYPVYHILYR